jgi:hypothetical protein
MLAHKRLAALASRLIASAKAIGDGSRNPAKS